MEEASGHHTAYGTMWLQFSQHNLCGKLGGGRWSLDSTDEALQAVSSHVLNKVSWTAAGTVSWILLSALTMNTDSTLQDAALVLCARDTWENWSKNPASLTVRHT